MPLNNRLRLVPVIAAVVTAFTAIPTPADAQPRGQAQPRGAYHGGPVVRPPARQVVVVGGYGYGYGYPFYPYIGFGFGYGYPCCGPWGAPWGYPWGYPPYGYGYYGYPAYDPLTSSVRLDIDQRDAQVFVDGYSAGVVDEFDGTFQRLRVQPGAHEITVYLNGYRTIRRSLYLGPGTDQKVRMNMDKLGGGETSEPPPPPSDPPSDPDTLQPRQRYEPQREQRPPDRAPEREVEVARAAFGTVVIRVQPADAEVFVDGEKWSAPAEQERLSIRLTEGRHHIEVRKDGFATYTEEILIRRNATMTLNVSLRR